jgi:hypothetical protein
MTTNGRKIFLNCIIRNLVCLLICESHCLSERNISLSASIDSNALESSPLVAMVRNSLNAAGSKLSCVSPSVRVSVRTRSGYQFLPSAVPSYRPPRVQLGGSTLHHFAGEGGGSRRMVIDGAPSSVKLYGLGRAVVGRSHRRPDRFPPRFCHLSREVRWSQ